MKNKFLLFSIFIFLFSINGINADEKFQVTLDKCVDGDTAWFNVDGKSKKFRFLAINTPESTNKNEKYGKEASEFTCNLLTNATKIEIEYDPNSDKTDKYDRYLAWIFVDDELLQSLIIEEGLGEVKYIYGNYKYTSLLEEKQKEAQKQELNIWSNDETSFNDKMYNNKLFVIVFLILLTIIFIFNKKMRKKIINKSKKEIKKKLIKSFK